jgi:hypothetical protein
VAASVKQEPTVKALAEPESSAFRQRRVSTCFCPPKGRCAHAGKLFQFPQKRRRQQDVAYVVSAHDQDFLHLIVDDIVTAPASSEELEQRLTKSMNNHR